MFLAQETLAFTARSRSWNPAVRGIGGQFARLADWETPSRSRHQETPAVRGGTLRRKSGWDRAYRRNPDLDSDSSPDHLGSISQVSTYLAKLGLPTLPRERSIRGPDVEPGSQREIGVPAQGSGFHVGPDWSTFARRPTSAALVMFNPRAGEPFRDSLQSLFRTSVGTCYLQKTCGKPVFHVRTRKLAPISQSPQQVASRNSHEMCGKSVASLGDG
jgi:hypothetical protein